MTENSLASRILDPVVRALGVLALAFFFFVSWGNRWQRSGWGVFKDALSEVQPVLPIHVFSGGAEANDTWHSIENVLFASLREAPIVAAFVLLLVPRRYGARPSLIAALVGTGATGALLAQRLMVQTGFVGETTFKPFAVESVQGWALALLPGVFALVVCGLVVRRDRWCLPTGLALALATMGLVFVAKNTGVQATATVFATATTLQLWATRSGPEGRTATPPTDGLTRLERGAAILSKLVLALSILFFVLLAARTTRPPSLYDRFSFLAFVPEIDAPVLHRDSLRAVAFSEDGAILASADDGGAINLWSVATGLRLQTIQVAPATYRGTYSLSFSPDNRFLAVAVWWGIQLWPVRDVLSGPRAFTLPGDDKSETFSVAFSPDGEWLASGHSDGARLWSVRDRSVRRLDGHRGPVSSVAFSPDGRQVASASWDTTVRLWSVLDASCVRVLEGHPWRLTQVVFSPTGGLMASVSDSAPGFSAGPGARRPNSLRLWSVVDGTPRKTLREDVAPECPARCAAFSPSGEDLAEGSAQTGITIWSTRDATVRRTIDDKVNTLAWSPQGDVLAAGVLHEGKSRLTLLRVETHPRGSP